MELWLEMNQCDHEMKKCEKTQTHKFSRYCQRLKDTHAFYYSTLASIQPPMTSCPMRANIYTATNSSIDLMAMSFLPLSNSLWITTAKTFSGEGRRKELAMCAVFEIKITQSKARRKAFKLDNIDVLSNVTKFLTN